MNHRSLTLFLPLVGLLAAGCSGLESLGVKQKGGLDRVDDLLSHVERVQVESAVTKERSQEALERLRDLIAPEFQGDAAEAHEMLVDAVELSEDQTDGLKQSLRPLTRTGATVFRRWAEDLESFGNVAMRQRSQERLEETRRRYDAILAASASALLACDSFNSDLTDHALFLEHDFNTTSVALIAQEFDALKGRARELAKRLDLTSAACQDYVEFAAPKAQITPEELEETPEPEPTPEPAKKKLSPRKTTSKGTSTGSQPD